MAILFLKDWERFPTAIIDYNTPNESWLRLAYLYDKMGVTNSTFHLCLMQPELSGIDPYDPALDSATQLKIAVECRYNPWYYFREVVRVPPPAGTEPVPLQANRGNIALYWSFFNHIDFALLQPRQTGKSISADSLSVGLLFVWMYNATMSLITLNRTLRERNIRRLKGLRDYLPKYIYSPDRDDADNTEIITNIKFNNFLQTAVAQADKEAADRMGRGHTVPVIQVDETAYVTNLDISLPVALSSASAARDHAKKAGQPFGNYYTTTAGNILTREGKYAYDLFSGGAVWTEHFFDLEDQKELERAVERASKGDKPMIYGSFNHRQLGYSDEWLYRKLRETASRGEVGDRDWMMIFTIGSEESPLEEFQKDQVKNSLRDPDYTEITDEGYTFRWYIPKDEIEERLASSSYVLGCDPSEAVSVRGDGLTLVLLDAYTHDVVMSCGILETNTIRFANLVCRFLEKYPSVTFIPERKSIGMSILDAMFIQLTSRNIDPFRRIYNRIVDESADFPQEFKTISQPMSRRPHDVVERYRRYFGFVTSSSGRHARSVLYGETFQSLLSLGLRRIHDRPLGMELLTLQNIKGRIDHPADSKDDLVVSLLLAHWFCTQSRNLEHYGIDPRRVFSHAKTTEEDATPEERLKQIRQQRDMETFNHLLDELKQAQDQAVVLKLEAQLQQLSTRLDLNEVSGVGIDALLSQAREERKRKQRLRRSARRDRFGYPV